MTLKQSLNCIRFFRIRFAVFMLFVFIFTNTTFTQIFQLPVLIHHFWEHQDENHSLTWTEFLSEHYAETIGHSDDKHHDHEKLPYKSKAYLLAQSISIIPDVDLRVKIAYFPSVTISFTAFTPSHLSEMFASSIWQPPKTPPLG